MRKLFLGTVSIAALLALSQAAFAADDTKMGTSRTYEQDQAGGYLRSEKVAVKPQVGVVAYSDILGQNTARGATGLAVDANVIKWAMPEQTNFYLGPSSGVIYSHLGSPSSNFVGTNSDIGVQSDANLLMIPVDLKGGYTFGDNFRLAVHAGGNVVYRSVASSLNLGTSSTDPGYIWSFFPNTGVDVEVALGNNMELSLRPDMTFTPGNQIFSGMLALGFSLS